MIPFDDVDADLPPFLFAPPQLRRMHRKYRCGSAGFFPTVFLGPSFPGRAVPSVPPYIRLN
jgi:hypothetical protein